MKKEHILPLISGFLLGVSVAFLVGILYLRTNLIIEIPVPGKLETISSGVTASAAASPGWRAEEVSCRLPDSPDGPVKSFRFCNLEHAKEMLENSTDRKIAAFLPCSMAVYAKADGKLYAARPNMPLISLLTGGAPGYVFRKKIAPEQREIMDGIYTRQFEKAIR